MTEPTEDTSTNKKSAVRNQHSFRTLFLDLLFNIIIPTLILTKLSGSDFLGVKQALIVAIAFPICYGLKDLIQQHKINFFSALGIINVALTGGIGLLELDASYLAIKEATIPAIFGIATLISLKTSRPLINTFIFNDMIIEIDKVNLALAAHNKTLEFKNAMLRANYIVAGSFFLSSTLNYMLARIIVVSQPGTEAFNAELGKMTALSYPVIAIPSTIVLMFALWYLFNSIQRLTDLKLEDIVKQH